jgi:hypothetical protein
VGSPSCSGREIGTLDDLLTPVRPASDQESIINHHRHFIIRRGAGVMPTSTERIEIPRGALERLEHSRLRRGKRVGLSLQRKFVCDLLAFAKDVPSVPMQRRMQLGELIAARSAATQRVSWSAIFLKAYSILSAKRPELRRAYLPYPWPHLYEHPATIASFSLEREYRGERGVFLVQIQQPERFSLVELDAFVRHYKYAPLEQVPAFRRAIQLTRLPRPLRRLVWRSGLHLDGMYRAKFFGTFALSTVASFGAAGLHLLSPLTTTLNYGTFEPGGAIDVRLTYDHRVLDGATVARAMVALEEVLRGRILSELSALAASPPASEHRSHESRSNGPVILMENDRNSVAQGVLSVH